MNRKTGISIAGTSTQTGKPNCDENSAKSSLISRVTTSFFPWKKCPEEAKTAFKSDLMIYLTFVMDKETNSSSKTEETVAKWHFFKMDSNQDGVRIFLVHFESIF